MPERWDNIEILRAIDRLQANAAGAAAWLNGQQLMSEITGTYTVDQSRWAGFVQELLIARDAGLLTFTPPYRVGGSRPAEPSDPNMYLQSISDFALTVAGQDRARGRMLAIDPPDPAEDDGRLISSLTLGIIADAIAEKYTPEQAAVFLREAGLPPATLTPPADANRDDVRGLLQFLADHSGSEGRRALRSFIGSWLNDRLPIGPSDELRARLVEQLARQGWHVRDDRLVIGERAAGRLIGSPLLRDARLAALHPEVLAVAEKYIRSDHPATAVFEALKAVNLRVKQMTGRGDDGSSMMGSVLSGTVPILMIADPSTETGRSIQDGYKFLFMGAMLALRNPAAHEQLPDMHEAEAFDQLSFTSILMRALDAAAVQTTTT